MLPALLLLLAPPAAAKDLNGRLGLGFSQQFGGTGTMTAISVRWGLPTGKPATNIAVELDAGADYGTSLDFFGGGRILFGLVAEDNMNFNLGLGGGYLQRNVIALSDTGASEPTPYGTIRLQPSLGAEFFLFGLENLGFTAEFGVNVDLTDGALRATTVGGAPGVGMHYYF